MAIKIQRGKLNAAKTDLVNDSTLVEYIFSNVNNVTDRGTNPNTNLNSPGKDSSETTQLNLGGKQAFLSFDFILINDGTDHSNGTSGNDATPSGCTSVQEQFLYLKKFHTGGYDRQYKVTIDWDGVEIVTFLGLIDDLSMTPRFEDPTKIRATIQLSEGKNALSVSTS